MKHEKNLFWYDFLRGSAALLVLIGHLRSLLFQPFSGQSSSNIGKLFFFVTGFGHEAVIIFFVLSGFFIIRSIHEAVILGKWSASEYAKNRLTRLWTVLLPALLLTLCWDMLGLRLLPNAEAYTGTIPNMPGLNPASRLGWTTFLGNLFFLQHIRVDTFGSNPALWSLANEFWYYLIFPLLYFSLQPFYSAALRVLLLMLALLCFIFIGQGIAIYFIVWLMGGITYMLVKNCSLKYSTSWIIRSVLIILFVVVLSFMRMNLYPIIFNDFSLGVVTSLLLVSLAFAKMKSLSLQRIATSLSAVSYSVYLTHLSFAVFLTSLWHRQSMIWSYSNLGYYLILLIIILVYCAGMYFLFERNTQTIKKFITRQRTLNV